MKARNLQNLTPYRASAVLLVLGWLPLAGCSRPAPPSEKGPSPAYDETTGRLKTLSYDANGDGVTETWGYMDGARVIRVEADENQDGTIDRWEYHRQDPGGVSQANPLASIERVERATHHDGKVSRWEFFEKGALSRVEEDTTGDGLVDKWETYSDGTLASLALDSRGVGKPERTLFYRPDGSFDRIETYPISPSR